MHLKHFPLYLSLTERLQDCIQKVREYVVCDYRYASLYIIISIDKDENELMALEFIQDYVETLDQYFGNVIVLLLFYIGV